MLVLGQRFDGLRGQLQGGGLMQLHNGAAGKQGGHARWRSLHPDPPEHGEGHRLTQGAMTGLLLLLHLSSVCPGGWREL